MVIESAKGFTPSRGMRYMKALTVKWPWAWAIIHAGKDVENRSWHTGYRGSLAIHAGLSVTRTYHAWTQVWMAAIGVEAPEMPELPRGCVVGTVDLVDCVRDSGSRWAMPGQWHWVLRNPQPCKPRFVRGALGLWTWAGKILYAYDLGGAL